MCSWPRSTTWLKKTIPYWRVPQGMLFLFEWEPLHLKSPWNLFRLIITGAFLRTEIEWYPGKNVTQKVMQKKSKKGSKNAKPVRKVEECESFFNFFDPPKVPEDDEDLDEETVRPLIWKVMFSNAISFSFFFIQRFEAFGLLCFSFAGTRIARLNGTRLWCWVCFIRVIFCHCSCLEI